MSERGCRTTELEGARATWYVCGGVVYVTDLRDADGGATTIEPALSLGECFDRMPRKLWDKVRRDFERDRENLKRLSDNGSPRPGELDVHLRVRLYRTQFDYVACLTAALLFIQDHERHHGADSVTILGGDTTGLRRLPCERLYLEP